MFISRLFSMYFLYVRELWEMLCIVTTYSSLLGATESHKDPRGSMRIHEEPRGSTKIHQDPPGSTRIQGFQDLLFLPCVLHTTKAYRNEKKMFLSIWMKSPDKKIGPNLLSTTRFHGVQYVILKRVESSTNRHMFEDFQATSSSEIFQQT